MFYYANTYFHFDMPPPMDILLLRHADASARCALRAAAAALIDDAMMPMRCL